MLAHSGNEGGVQERERESLCVCIFLIVLPVLIHEGNKGRGREGGNVCVCPSLSLSSFACTKVVSFGEHGNMEREPLCVSLPLIVCISVDSVRKQGRCRESLSVFLIACINVGSLGGGQEEKQRERICVHLSLSLALWSLVPSTQPYCHQPISP